MLYVQSFCSKKVDIRNEKKPSDSYNLTAFFKVRIRLPSLEPHLLKRFYRSVGKEIASRKYLKTSTILIALVA